MSSRSETSGDAFGGGGFFDDRLDRSGIRPSNRPPAVAAVSDSEETVADQIGTPIDEPSGKDTIVIPGVLLADKFRLVGPLGDGGMGKVWLAMHVSLGRMVALKLLHRSRHEQAAARERFRREAHTVGQLKHPGIVEALDFGTLDDGRDFLALEYVDGITIKRLLADLHTLPWRTVRRVATDLAHALAFLHENGFIHRDLKPSNLIVEGGDPSRGRTRILDLGIARNAQAPRGVTLTKPGKLLGTPSYAAPEQLRGDAVDERADLYSLGVVLYQAICGALPYQGDNFVDIVDAQTAGPPPSLSEVAPDRTRPRAFDQLIMRLLDRDPDRRPRSARALVDRLEQVDSAPVWTRRHSRTIALSAGAVVLVAVGAAIGASLVLWLAG